MNAEDRLKGGRRRGGGWGGWRWVLGVEGGDGGRDEAGGAVEGDRVREARWVDLREEQRAPSFH